MTVVSLLAAAGACEETGPELADTGTTQPEPDTGTDTSTPDTAVDSGPPDATDTGRETTDARDTTDADADTGCGAGHERLPDGGCRAVPRGTPADQCPSGNYAGGSIFEGEGVCLAEKPRGNEAGEPCPSGRFFAPKAFTGDGVCRPQRPTLDDWTCENGWTSARAFVDLDGDADLPAPLQSNVDLCRPPDLPTSCARGKIAPAGATACRRHGTACPAAGQSWLSASDIRAQTSGYSGAIHYVAANDGSNGRGTRQSPYHSVDKALSAASGGDIIALSRGAHSKPIDTEKRVAFVGACVAETTLDTIYGGTSRPLVDLRGSKGATLANLAVSARTVGIHISATADVHLRNIAVLKTEKAAIRIDGGAGTVHLDSVAVRDVREDLINGDGLFVRGDATVRVADSVFDECAHHGASISGKNGKTPNVTLTDSVVRRVQPSGGIGDGITASNGARVALTRTIVRNVRSTGLQASDAGTEIDVVQSAVSEVTGSKSEGVEISENAKLTTDRLYIADVGQNGLMLKENARGPSITRVAIRSTPSGERDGTGVRVKSGAEATFEQLIASRRVGGQMGRTDNAPEIFGFAVKQSTTDVDLVDSVIWRTEVRSDDRFAFATGLEVTRKAGFEARRTIVARNEGRGLDVNGNDTSIQLTDVTFRGNPLTASVETRVTGKRIHITDNESVGIYAGKATVDLDEARIANLASGGYGITGVGGTLKLTDSIVDDVARAGTLFLSDPTLDLRDTVIRNTGVGDEMTKAGIGIGMQTGGSLTIRRVHLKDNRMTDIDVPHGGATIDIRDLTVQKSAAGGSDQLTPYGLAVESDPASADLARVHMTGASGVGFYLKGVDGMQLRDLVVEQTRTDADGLGDGLYVFSNADVTLERGLIADNQRHGLVVSNAEMTASDVALLRNGGAGLIRQSKAGWQPTRIFADGNKQGRQRCTQQCYSPPKEPEDVQPAGGL